MHTLIHAIHDIHEFIHFIAMLHETGILDIALEHAHDAVKVAAAFLS